MAAKTQDCEYFLGIDLGCYETKIVLAKIQSWKVQTLEIVKAFSCPTQGLFEKGSIVEADKLIHELNTVLVSNLASFLEQHMYVSFSMKNRSIQSKIIKIQNPFSKRKRAIEKKDIDVLNHMVTNTSIEDGRDYITTILRKYLVDGQTVKHPIGHIGFSLEAELLLVSTSEKEIDIYEQCAKKMNLNTYSFCIDSLAVGEYLLTNDEKEQGVMLFDIGAQSVSVAWYDQGSARAVVVVPFGIDDICKDIQNELHISMLLARDIVHNYSCLDTMYLSEIPPIEEVRTEDGFAKHIDTRMIYQISYARMLDIFIQAYRLLQLKENAAVCPAVITGGGARLRGINSFVENRLQTKVRLAQPSNWGGPIHIYRSPNYAVAIGLCVNGFQQYSYAKQNETYNVNTKNKFLAAYGKQSEKQIKTENWLFKVSKSIKNFFSLNAD